MLNPRRSQAWLTFLGVNGFAVILLVSPFIAIPAIVVALVIGAELEKHRAAQRSKETDHEIRGIHRKGHEHQ